MDINISCYNTQNFYTSSAANYNMSFSIKIKKCFYIFPTDLKIWQCLQSIELQLSWCVVSVLLA